MKLTRHTDYALRVMIYLARPGDGLVSIRQIAGVYGISQNHLMKIVQSLGHAGFVETVRGRHGGCGWRGRRIRSRLAGWCAIPRAISGWSIVRAVC